MKKYVIMILLTTIFALFTTSCPPPGGGGGGGGIDWSIPKTGQDADDTTATGDDGDLQMGADWPVPRFTNNGDGTVTDNFTGLMWEQSPSTDTISWADALTYANASELAGYDDWRLPNRNELITLHNFGEYHNDIWLNGQGFSNIQFSYYWTSTTRIGDTASANVFYVGVRNADIGSHTKTDDASRYAIICRGSSDYIMKTGQTESYAAGDDGDLEMGAAWPDPRFTDNGDGTLTDNLTGLMWEQSPDTTQKTWSSALTYANDSLLATYDDWRLPNFYELATLMHAAQATVSTWLNASGFSNVQSCGYWSSTYTPIIGTDYVICFLTMNSTTVATGVTDPTQSVNMRAIIVRGTADGE
ncbi:MAG: DUF1566 domain-containing protein [Spirochaetales bacterium]|nr:DUF1566 domain-containing protein [Spirochaetales bacterium]